MAKDIWQLKQNIGCALDKIMAYSVAWQSACKNLIPEERKKAACFYKYQAECMASVKLEKPKILWKILYFILSQG